MKLKISRCLLGFIAVLFLCVLCLPVFASNSEYVQKATFFQWTGSMLQDLIGYSFGLACSNSGDGYHHANSYQKAFGDGYYSCICTYCGHSFTAYESDLQQSYTDYVGTLPATGYNSAGHLIWQPSYADLSSIYIVVRFGSAYANYFTIDGLGSFSKSSTSFCYIKTDVTSDSFLPGLSIRISPQDGQSGGNPLTFESYSFNFKVPISGSYTQLKSLAAHWDLFTSVGNTVTSNEYYSSGSYGYKSSGGTIYSNLYDVSLAGESRVVTGYVYLYFPVYEIIPDTLTGDTYSVTTRPTTITGGNYGIVGDNGQITTVTNNSSIINETNNTYYNPATGNSETVTNWTYDYSDRSYNITLESGDTVTVTYGDENITIVEGDINYTIYYIIEGSGSDPDPDISSDPGTDDNCTHEWYQTGHREGNCVTSEQRTYTCKLCGKQYTETDPAPGHSWRIIQEVSTKYDDSGNLMQEGYTIYECERCGEQYKSTNDTGPPASGGGSSGGSSGTGSSGNIFSGIFGIIWDFFTFFFDFFSDFVVGGIKGFISAILDVGSDFFAILNPFDWGY